MSAVSEATGKKNRESLKEAHQLQPMQAPLLCLWGAIPVQRSFQRS